MNDPGTLKTAVMILKIQHQINIHFIYFRKEVSCQGEKNLKSDIIISHTASENSSICPWVHSVLCKHSFILLVTVRFNAVMLMGARFMEQGSEIISILKVKTSLVVAKHSYGFSKESLSSDWQNGMTLCWEETEWCQQDT